ncbi:MAG: hypothetical protein M0C28_28975 [Candidatus Moduliflexus flocculans]|nr:hypothetical protein [Candidatus Moduliflexus flocculans]
MSFANPASAASTSPVRSGRNIAPSTNPHSTQDLCHTYKCKLLKLVLDDVTPLPSALTVVRRTKSLIHALDAVLPASPSLNFRERLAACLEREDVDPETQQKAKELLEIYESQFGVNDLLDNPPQNS